MTHIHWLAFIVGVIFGVFIVPMLTKAFSSAKASS